MIKYNPVYSFTSDDIASEMWDFGLEGVIFTCLTYRPAGWTEKVRKLFDNEDSDLACEVVGDILIKLEQGENTHLIGSIEQAKALMKDIDRQAPGHGPMFIRSLAFALFDRQTKMEQDRLKNLPQPLPVLENGNGKQEQRSAVKA